MSQRINLDVHRKLSLLAGFSYPMPENYSSRSKCFRLFWSLYVCVPFGFMLVELVSQAIQITLSIDNLETITTCTLSTVYIVQFLLKVGVFWRSKETFERVFQEMSAISRDLTQNPFNDDTFMKFFNEKYRTVFCIGVVKGSLQLACNLGLNILFCVLSWIGMKPKITAAYSWTPYDTSTNPGYTFTCLFEMIAYGAVTARTGVFDLLFWVMVIIPTVQLNYLKHLMEIMFKDVDDAEQIMDNDKTDSGNEAMEDVLSSQLEWWMGIHQRILRMVLDFENLASPFLAVNFISSMIDLFMSGFVAISSSHWDIFQRILINAIIITDAFQLYVISLAGDWLRESSQNVADLGFSALIFKLRKGFRRKYLFILSRTRQLIKIRFGGIYPLSSQTFSSVRFVFIHVALHLPWCANYFPIRWEEITHPESTKDLIQLTLTYFVTVIQIRKKQNEDQLSDSFYA